MLYRGSELPLEELIDMQVLINDKIDQILAKKRIVSCAQEDA